MKPVDLGRLMYESAPGDGGELPWEQLTLVAQEAWVRAALAYEEKQRPPGVGCFTVELIREQRLDGQPRYTIRVGSHSWIAHHQVTAWVVADVAERLGAKVVRS